MQLIFSIHFFCLNILQFGCVSTMDAPREIPAPYLEDSVLIREVHNVSPESV
jgi:hypothetical protein